MQAQKDIVNRKMFGHDDITSSEDCGIEKDYQKFLQDSNCMDFCDIYNVFKQEFDKNEELQKEKEKQTFVFLDVPKSKAEVSVYTLLMSPPCKGRETYCFSLCVCLSVCPSQNCVRSIT